MKSSQFQALTRPCYECVACGVTHASAIGLPIGWSQTAGGVWCPDCTAAGVPARELRQLAGQRTRDAA